MTPPLTFSRSGPRPTALALTLTVHLLLLLGWQAARRPLPVSGADPQGMQLAWFTSAPPATVRPAATVAPPMPRSRPPAPAIVAPPQPMPTAASVPVPAATSAPAPSAAPAAGPTLSAQPEAPAAHSVDDMLRLARSEAGKIDRELRAASPGQLHAAPDTALSRFQEKMDAATKAPAFYEAPKITQVYDQGGYGRRIYKVQTGGVVYCITVESNHAVDGLDTMKNGIRQKITTCPRELPIR